jgi:hypothetical protein
MRRIGLMVLLATMVLGCLVGAEVWQVTTPPTNTFVIPDARAVQVEREQPGQQTIAYDVTHADWRRVIDQRLRERGWHGIDETNPYDYDNYYRLHHYWFITITETAAVRGTSTHAEITIRRRMIVFRVRFP